MEWGYMRLCCHLVGSWSLIAVILHDFACHSRVCTYADKVSAGQYGPLFGGFFQQL